MILEKLQHYCATQPEHPAIIVDNKSYTYATFWADIQIAMARISAQNKHRIIVHVGRDYATYVTIAAVFCLKKCFVPINTHFPKARQAQMMDIVSGASEPDEAAIFFTSGTTGTPKAAMLSYDNLAYFFNVMDERFDISHNDRIAQFATLSFDMALFDLWMSWRTGSTLYVIPQSMQMMPAHFLKQHKISIMFATPALISFMDKLKQLGPFPDMRITLFAGEALTVDAAKKWLLACPNTALHNFYGPIETTIDVLAQAVTLKALNACEQTVVSIGTPFNGIIAGIINKNNTFLSAGEKGQLVVAGPLLGKGYINADNSKSFAQLDHPKHGSQRFYYTGDICYQDNDGLFHYVGRIDHQVKLNGHRVEIEEIEHHLKAITGTPAAVTIINKSIVGFITRPSTQKKNIQQQLAKTLPPYMLPERLISLDQLPINANGKLDRQALQTYIGSS
jgi:D-alanine--poly(phosphoribitol) ligase subunit 1